jgi:hypothetical protein
MSREKVWVRYGIGVTAVRIVLHEAVWLRACSHRHRRIAESVPIRVLVPSRPWVARTAHATTLWARRGVASARTTRACQTLAAHSAVRLGGAVGANPIVTYRGRSGTRPTGDILPLTISATGLRCVGQAPRGQWRTLQRSIDGLAAVESWRVSASLDRAHIRGGVQRERIRPRVGRVWGRHVLSVRRRIARVLSHGRVPPLAHVPRLGDSPGVAHRADDGRETFTANVATAVGQRRRREIGSAARQRCGREYRKCQDAACTPKE